MKYSVDEALCAGRGMCAANASSVYELDDEGFNKAIDTIVDIPADLEVSARRGAESCPEQAIRIDVN